MNALKTSLVPGENGYFGVTIARPAQSLGGRWHAFPSFSVASPSPLHGTLSVPMGTPLPMGTSYLDSISSTLIAGLHTYGIPFTLLRRFCV
jgi:hypothetical protein